MGDLQAAHCRLCAELKSYGKLLDLETDGPKKNVTFEKLSRLGVSVRNLGSVDDILPKTICFVCMELLDKCFSFVCAVETAQNVLGEYISQKIKEEVCSYDDEEQSEPLKTEEVKIEPQPADTSEDNTEIQNNDKFDSLDTLPLSQLKLSWKDYSWKCAFCDTLFPNIEELKEHALKFHGCCNSYRCPDCNKRKLKLDSFVIHMRRHRNYLKLSCFRCYKEFSKPHEYHKHKSVHFGSNYRCHGCNETFSSQEELSRHVVTYYKDRSAVSFPETKVYADGLSCTLCQKTFSTKGSLKLHLTIHADRKKNHTCEKCGKCYYNKNTLEGHMLSHNTIRQHQCEICKKRFVTKSHLRRHIGIHNTAKPYSCKQCGKRFRLENLLTSHSIVHTNSMPYKCTVCDKAFRFRTTLRDHFRQHTGDKPYNCQICARDFTNWPNYNKHMKVRHSMNMAKKTVTPDGVFPIDPATGEAVVLPQTPETVEWMKKVMEGPRKTKSKGKNVKGKMLNANKNKN